MKFQTSTLRQNSFAEMNLAPSLLTAIKKMSIVKPTPIQALAIPLGLNGQDIISIAQTGSGKTLAYALSTLTHLSLNPESRALILAPSREMAQQIYTVFIDLCAELPIIPALVIGGKGTGAKQTSQLKKKPRVIIATPGRLNDHLLTNKLLLQNVNIIVIDEADRMLDMGFSPQLLDIRKTMRGKAQVSMFSASFSANVEEIAKAYLSNNSFMVRTEGAEAPVTALKQKILFLDRSMKNDRLLEELNATTGGVLIFTGNQESCEKVGAHLKQFGYSSDLVHGALSQGHRNRVVNAFRDGEIRVLVTTDLLARGLDIPLVAHVINFDMPFKAEDFLHRIGRTARAGKSGNAITFVTPADAKIFRKIQGYIVGAKEVMVDPRFNFIDRPPRRVDKVGFKNNERASYKGATKGSQKSPPPPKFKK